MGERPFLSFIPPSSLQAWTPWIKQDSVEMVFLGPQKQACLSHFS